MTLQLEIGRTYRNHEGFEVKIVSMRAASAYRYKGDDGSHYAEDGRFNLDEPGHGFDLVEECEPDEVMAEAPNAVPLCEVICEDIADAFLPNESGAAALAIGITLKHFAALSVEQVAKALCGWRNGKRVVATLEELSDAEKNAYRDQARDVMKLLRKE